MPDEASVPARGHLPEDKDADSYDDINTDPIVSLGLARGKDFSVTGEPVLVKIPADLITAYGVGSRVLWTATSECPASEPDLDPGSWTAQHG